MQGQPLLDDDLSWMDSMTGGEIFLTDENVAPVMPMPDAPETGLGTEPADQPFEMDMSNISSSLMQSVAERGSSSKRPVDRSVPSSSNNEATNAASTPVRALAMEQPRLDDGLGGETGLLEEPRAPVVLTTDEPETRQRTEQAHQSFETNTKSISSSSMMDDVLRMCVLPLIACKVTVGRPSFSLLEDLNYTISKSELVTEAWFYDLMIDNANFLLKISFRKIVIVNCENMRSLCPSMDGITELEILHLDVGSFLKNLSLTHKKMRCTVRSRARWIWHCATGEAGSIFMALNEDQKASNKSKAALHGLLVAHQTGFVRVVLESDCLSLNLSSTTSSIGKLLHSLANLGRLVEHVTVLMEVSPSSV
ncbi:hypothetical protein DKX38_026553 [Salix brachista]|uniref:Uncharacterized protein n=1 Tax=Salix brachista TaxID=2182728 RepID=A0A5N5JEX1_9ROSI|nr:hypothetical protein DKX38_026553 [Salix brachista]